MKRIKNFIQNSIKGIYRLTLDSDNVEMLTRKGVKIGERCRIFSDKVGSEPYLITIGNDVTISNNVQFITHDGGVHVLRKDKLPNADLIGEIIIQDNCFIGANTIILPNVEIGENVIIGAGSVITKSIPSNVVAAGVPAKVIKNLDEYYDGIKDKVIYTYGMGAEEKEKAIKSIIDGKKK